MNLPPLPFVVLDTETTGFVPRVHSVIEYASVQVEGGKVIDTFEELFYAEEIPAHVEVLTRIRTEDVKNKTPFTQHAERILAQIPPGTLIVGQNVGFDLGMLKGSGIDLSDRPWIDTSMLASLVFPELASYSLGYLSRTLGLTHEPEHRALGDVHATLELLSRVWERLLELPSTLRGQALEVMGRSTPGYKAFFEALPPSKAKKAPAWLTAVEPIRESESAKNVPPLLAPGKGEIALHEESLVPGQLPGLLGALQGRGKQTHWIAVKNLDVQLRRMPEEVKADKNIRIAYPAGHLIDSDAAERLLQAEAFTADEATIALKILWYKPKNRNDFPLHGGEESVWYGKVACTEESKAYAAQFADLPHTILLDHKQLLRALEDKTHPAAKVIDDAHVILDDASMLEDTATRAYGWTVILDDLRAGAAEHPTLLRFVDLLQLWIEKVRQAQDLRYLTDGDLQNTDAAGLRERLALLLSEKDLTSQSLTTLKNLERILDPKNLQNRLAWIELRQNGSQTIQSVPERIGTLLKESLFSRCKTTLIIPPGSSETLGEVCPDDCKVRVDAQEQPLTILPLTFPAGRTAKGVLENPPVGKTVILVQSKGAIERLYVDHMEALERKGITLISQGLSGGQGRMQAEFTASKGQTIWLITPWTFEGIDLPPGTVDHLVVACLPFDYYSHPVLSRRAAHYRDPFSEYLFPRLLHRLFRLLRTYSQFRTAEGDVEFLDERIRTKDYGKRVVKYVSQFALPSTEASPVAQKSGAKKSGAPKTDQLPLF